jgi:hypothetical protein
MINLIKIQTQNLYSDNIKWEEFPIKEDYFKLNVTIHSDAVTYNENKVNISNNFNNNSISQTILKISKVHIERITGELELFGRIIFEILQIKTLTCNECIKTFLNSNESKCMLCTLKKMSRDELNNLLKIKNNLKNSTFEKKTIIVENNPQSNDIPSDSPYFKYFKMLKMKIPKQAISQKMRVDGFEDWIVDLFENCENPNQFLLSVKGNTKTLPSNKVSLNELMSQKKLLCASNRKLNDVKKQSSSGFRISLESVKNRLLGLKKTGFNFS